MKPTEPIEGSKLYYYFSFLKRSEYKRLAVYLTLPDVAKQKGGKILQALTNRACEGIWKGTIYGDLLEAIAHKQTKNRTNTIVQEMSYATAILLDFMALQNNSQKHATKEISILRSLIERGALHYFDTELKSAKKAMGVPNSEQAFVWGIELKTLEYQADFQMKGRSQEVKTEGILNAINLQYIFLRLKYACVALNQYKIVSPKQERDKEAHLLRLIQRHRPQFPPIILAYELVYKMLVFEDKTNYFEEFKNLLGLDQLLKKTPASKKNRLPIEPEELKSLYEYYENYCIRKINEGNQDYLVKLCNLFLRQHEDSSILDASGKIAPEKYKNIIVALATIGKTKEAMSFVEEFKTKLSPTKNKRSFYTFSKGVIQYYQHKYKAARKSMTKVLEDFDDIFLGLDARCWLIKILSDQDDEGFLWKNIESFRIQVARIKAREKSIGERVNNYKKFVQFVTRFHTALESKQEEILPKLKQLSDDLEKEELKTNIRWLKEKLDYVMNKLEPKPKGPAPEKNH